MSWPFAECSQLPFANKACHSPSFTHLLSVFLLVDMVDTSLPLVLLSVLTVVGVFVPLELPEEAAGLEAC